MGLMEMRWSTSPRTHDFGGAVELAKKADQAQSGANVLKILYARKVGDLWRIAIKWNPGVYGVDPSTMCLLVQQVA